MFFLKKHWRFTVPVVVVLCVLLLGVVVMYSTSEPPEPKTVYAMPEHSPDNPPPINTGGIASPLPVQIGETTEPGESPTQEFVSDAESLESCCPDEPNDSEIAKEQSRDFAETDDEAIMRRYKEHLANDTLPHVPRAFDDEHLVLLGAYQKHLTQDVMIDSLLKNHTQFQSLTQDLFATLSSEERSEAITKAAQQLKTRGINAPMMLLEDLTSGGQDGRSQDEIISALSEMISNPQ